MIVYGAIEPHPPIVVPAVGGKRLKDCDQTVKALRELASRLKAREKDIDTIAVITPHGNVSQVSVPVYTSPIFEGDLASFNAPKTRYQFKGDTELAVALVKADQHLVQRSPETILDHGVLVPLHYVTVAGVRRPILPIAVGFLPLRKLFEFGKLLSATAEQLGRKLCVIASADMSHRLTADAPSGYDPAGQKFDEKLVSLVKDYNVEGILDFDPALAQRAGQDALWSIAILLGALDNTKVQQEVLSYEGPFGVGYMVASFAPLS